MWKGYSELGVASFDTPLLLILGSFNFMAKYLDLGFNDISIRLLFFFPYIFFAPLGMFLLTYHLTKSNLASSISALIYTLNTTIVALYSMGHILLTMPYIFFPFIILFTIKYFITKSLIYPITTSLLLILCSVYELRITYLIILWLTVFLLFFIIEHKIKQTFIFFTSIIGSLLLFNLFWILPYISLSESSSNVAILGRDLFGAGFISITHAFTNTHPFWGKDGLEIFTKQPVFFISFIYPIIAIIGILKNSKRKIILPFSILFVIGVFLTKQTNIPFTSIYEFLYLYLPGFNAFRESTKFLQIITFSSSILAGLYIQSLQKSKNHKLLFLTISLVLINILYIAYPIFNGSAKTLFISKDTSDINYINLNKYLEAKNDIDYFRILWIPVGPNLSIIKDKMPQLSYLKFSEYIETYSKVNYKGIKNKSIILSDPSLDILLDNYSVKYIILSNSESTVNENLYEWHEPKKNYSTILSRNKALGRVPISGSNIEIYENDNFLPHIHKISEDGISEIENMQVEPAQYRFSIVANEATKKKFFSEAYHPDWKIRVGEHNWFESLYNKNYYYPEKFHTKTDFGLNSWKIDPLWFKEQGFQEGDTIPITLYFAPQAWMNLGLIISMGTLIIIVGLLVYYTLKKK
jgi:hypothetical protein